MLAHPTGMMCYMPKPGDTPPHPSMHIAHLPVWAYQCPDCEPGLLCRAVRPQVCDADGMLYCLHHAPTFPGRTHVGANGKEYTDQRHWYWCPYGQHVITDWNGCGPGAHTATKRRTREPIICANCGTVFTPSRSDARTCSGRCRVALHRRSADL